MIESRSKGEWPINWRLTTFPADARKVLQIRNASEKYTVEHGMVGPVADLEAEQAVMDSSPIYARLHSGINQPITFVLPTSVLRVLSWLP